jgi:hypothetical protein
MKVLGSCVSCGVRQLYDLSLEGLEARLYQYHAEAADKLGIAPQGESPDYLCKGYTYVFSDSTRRGNGVKIAQYIRRHKLGKIIGTDVVSNPNTGRNIRTWLWVFNGTVPAAAKTKPFNYKSKGLLTVGTGLL